MRINPPPHYMVSVLDAIGERIGFRPVTLPGVPRVGDDIRIAGEVRRVIRVIWETGGSDWVDLWTEPFASTPAERVTRTELAAFLGEWETGRLPDVDGLLKPFDIRWKKSARMNPARKESS